MLTLTFGSTVHLKLGYHKITVVSKVSNVLSPCPLLVLSCLVYIVK